GPRRLRAPLRGRGPSGPVVGVERAHDGHPVGRRRPAARM
ncbi:MAG: Putative inner membrane protein, partial [uncultured Rubrobacteraceae bacterium]